ALSGFFMCVCNLIWHPLIRQVTDLNPFGGSQKTESSSLPTLPAHNCIEPLTCRVRIMRVTLVLVCLLTSQALGQQYPLAERKNGVGAGRLGRGRFGGG